MPQSYRPCLRTDHETYPLVISIPIHVGNMMRYSRRRFFFLYHGTLSSWMYRLKAVSFPPAPIAIASNLGQCRQKTTKKEDQKTEVQRRTLNLFPVAQGIYIYYAIAVLNPFAIWNSARTRMGHETPCGKQISYTDPWNLRKLSLASRFTLPTSKAESARPALSTATRITWSTRI